MNKYIIAMLVGSLLLGGLLALPQVLSRSRQRGPSAHHAFRWGNAPGLERQSRDLVCKGRRHPRRYGSRRPAYSYSRRLRRLPADSEVTAGQREEPPGSLLLGNAHGRLGVWELHPRHSVEWRDVGLSPGQEGSAARKTTPSRF